MLTACKNASSSIERWYIRVLDRDQTSDVQFPIREVFYLKTAQVDFAAIESCLQIGYRGRAELMCAVRLAVMYLDGSLDIVKGISYQDLWLWGPWQGQELWQLVHDAPDMLGWKYLFKFTIMDPVTGQKNPIYVPVTDVPEAPLEL